METMEDVLQAAGGFGKFQVALCFGLLSVYCAIGWSLMQLSFSTMIPHWHCNINISRGARYLTAPQSNDSMLDTSSQYYYTQGGSDGPNLSTSLGDFIVQSSGCYTQENASFETCSINGTECDSFCFEGSAKTIISEFDLVCDLKWTKQLITSLQMVGIFFGALLSGQLGDTFGRRKPFYGFLLLHGIFHLLAGFSVSWEMYTVCIILIGFAAGGNLVVIIPYSLEFFPTRWRGLSSIIPTFQIGVAIFAGFAYLLQNWSHIHFACAVFNLPFLLGWFFFPESARWLTAHGRIHESMRVIKKIARVNGTSVPPDAIDVLEAIAGSGKNVRSSERKYSYRDLFRTRKSTMTTIFISIIWIALTAGYYGISFGISSLGGNVYLNIFLVGTVEVPLNIFSLYLINKIGRRPSAILFFTFATLSSAGCIVAELEAPGSEKDTIISGLSLLSKMMVAAGFCVIFVWGIELYPTVTRNLGFGFANMLGRVGGIAAPFAINLDDRAVVSYVVLSAMMAVCTVLSFLLEETKGRELADTLHEDNDTTDSETTSATRPLYEGNIANYGSRTPLNSQ
ncbi:solute carrier family 22 member 4 [Aplysia californica]|uniref:Solute carrier family 22 member 4 n=1 Tax=Aplysia californica TaxID=6500 RepID=A0ABM0JRN4_APLCA|nr:solute carrier family 22 member 4 [Aplysia californica]